MFQLIEYYNFSTYFNEYLTKVLYFNSIVINLPIHQKANQIPNEYVSITLIL